MPGESSSFTAWDLSEESSETRRSVSRKRTAADLDDLLARLGDHLLVVGEEPLDEPHHQGDARAAEDGASSRRSRAAPPALLAGSAASARSFFSSCSPFLGRMTPFFRSKSPASGRSARRQPVAVGGHHAEHRPAAARRRRRSGCSGSRRWRRRRRSGRSGPAGLRVDVDEGELLEAAAAPGSPRRAGRRCGTRTGRSSPRGSCCGPASA